MTVGAGAKFITTGTITSASVYFLMNGTLTTVSASVWAESAHKLIILVGIGSEFKFLRDRFSYW